MTKSAVRSELIEAISELVGVEASMIRRVVIDIDTGRIPIVHIERFGDNSLLCVVRALDGIEIKREGD